MKNKILFSFFILVSLVFFTTANTPTVIWHGMGDTCCNPLSIGSLVKLIEQNITGIYVKSLQIGDNEEEDALNGFFKNSNDQIDLACEIIKNDSKLADGYNAVGFSQGGQFLRAVAQRCPNPPMKNLISIGGQHQGVYGFPRCPMNFTSVCDYVRKLLNLGAYIDFVQNRLVQAEYWHDPLQEKEYKEKSIFLADINQERKFNPQYKENLLKLKNLVLVMFEKDEMVVPKESEWFGFYKEGQSKDLYTMEESKLYKDDSIGLQTLDKTGRLFKLSVDGDHLRFSKQWFLDNIVSVYLKDN